MKLEKVVYAPECNSNLILLKQLQESKITYIDNSDSMTLIQKIQTIAHTKRDRNLVILDHYDFTDPRHIA